MKNPVSRAMMRNRMSTTALNVPRTLRPHDTSILLKMYPGKAVPVAAAGLLREDAVTNGRLNLTFEMSETAEALINPVTVRVSAYLVPWLAFERFAGRDEFEASYSGKPLRDGDDVIPFIETIQRGEEGDYPVMDALGLHASPTQDVSSMYVEAYNAIINFRNTQLSPDLPQRDRLQTDLAPAQRERGRHHNIVPNFDDAAMDGAVEIDVQGGSLGVKGIGKHNTTRSLVDQPVKDYDGDNSYSWASQADDGTVNARFYFEQKESGLPNVRVEMQDAEMSFSLASIERAKKLRTFAKLREQYNGLDDDDLINKLMDGIRMPEKMFEQPIYLGSEITAFGFSKRYSSDAENLDQSVVSGASMLRMQIATPRINTGGVVMFIAEVQPEQLFERQADPFLTITDVEKYPQFIRDDGDEQKVDIVKNWEIDTAHDDADGLFGYQPLNGKFMIGAPRIGTGYFQPEPTETFDEDRARIWDTSPANPALGTDWYLTTTVNTDVFEYTETEPFEASGRLDMVISGNTVFGQMLTENDGDYEAVQDRLPEPEDQINQPEE